MSYVVLTQPSESLEWKPIPHLSEPSTLPLRVARPQAAVHYQAPWRRWRSKARPLPAPGAPRPRSFIAVQTWFGASAWRSVRQAVSSDQCNRSSPAVSCDPEAGPFLEREQRERPDPRSSRAGLLLARSGLCDFVVQGILIFKLTQLVSLGRKQDNQSCAW